MDGLRKFGLWFLALVLGPAAVTAVVAFTFSRTMGSPDYVKQTFDEARVYASLGNFLEQEAAKTGEDNNKAIQRALAKTATQERLKSVVERAVDQAYAVLNGEIQAKDFSVDVSELKDDFIKNLDNSLTKELTGLPTCSFANPPTSTDVFEYSCLPAGADVDKIVAQARKEALSDNELLSSGEVNINNFKPDEKQQAAGETVENPVESFQRVANMYQLSKLVLPVALVLAVLSAIGIVLLSKSRLKGGRRVGMLLLGNAAILTIISFTTRTLAQNFPINNAEGTILPATAFEIAGQNIAIDFSTMTMQFGLGLVLIGLAVAVIMTVLIKKYEPKDDESPAPKEEPPLDLKAVAKQPHKSEKTNKT